MVIALTGFEFTNVALDIQSTELKLSYKKNLQTWVYVTFSYLPKDQSKQNLLCTYRLVDVGIKRKRQYGGDIF